MKPLYLYAVLHLISFTGTAQARSSTVERAVIIKNSAIYYYEKGNGKTPVVFVSGLGDDHATWETVQDSIAAYTLTLSYDRSGLGKSGYHQESKDLRSICDELNTLIHLAKLANPVILVGHSLGCQIVKQFAALHPASVKSIVFVDPGYNEETLRANVTDLMWKERETALKQYLPQFNAAQNEELKYANSAAALSDKIIIDTHIPVILFTATHVNPAFPCSQEELKVKEASHKQWLKRMPQAVHKYVSSSRHYIQNGDPSKIIQAIISLL